MEIVRLLDGYSWCRRISLYFTSRFFFPPVEASNTEVGGKGKKRKKAGNSKRASKHHQEPLLFNCRCDHER